MKRQSILFILVLLQVLFICIGCGSSEKSAQPLAAAAKETAVEEAAPAEASIQEESPEEEILAEQRASNAANVENVIGVFEGLEDNHTAIFSFSGAEEVFYFEDDAVQSVLFEAVTGSSYTLSYNYDEKLGNVIYEISE